MEKKTSIQKLFRFLLFLGAGLMLMGLLFLAGVYAIAVSDQEEVPLLVEELVQEKTGADLKFAHYRFELLSTFPFLSMVLEDIIVQDPAFEDHHEKLVRIDKIAVKFRFWNLFRRELAVHSLLLDGGGVTLFRNADGSYFNADFLKGKEKKEKTDNSEKHPLFSLEHIRVKNFAFLFLDSLHSKSYHFDLVNTRVDFNESGAKERINLRGDWFFHGLTFKFKNGAYLKDKMAKVDWRLTWDHDSNRLDIGPADLNVDGENFVLSGYLGMGKPAYLKLIIDHPGIRLEAGRKVIADNIRNALCKFEIDQPIETRVVVEGPLITGRPAPVEVFFSTETAVVSAGKIEATETFFSGRFYNCDPDGPVNPHSGCLSFDTLSTRLYDLIPVQGQVLLKDLVDPEADLVGKVNMPLEELNTLLPAGRIDLRDGDLELNLQYQGKLEAFSKPAALAELARIAGNLRLQDATLVYPPTGLRLNRLNADFRFNEEDLWINDLQVRLGESPLRIRGMVHDLLPFVLSSDRQLQASLDLKAGKLDIDQLFPPKPKPVRSEKASDGSSTGVDVNPITEVAEALLEEFNAEINAEVDELTIRGFRATEVRWNSRFLSSCAAVDSAGCVLIDTLRARIYGDIPIAASLKVTDLDNPHLAMNMQLNTPVSAFRKMFPADQIQLQKGDLALAFQYQGTLNDYFGLSEAVNNARFGGQIDLEGIDADYAGKYRIRDLSANLHLDEHDLDLRSVNLALNDNEVELSGRLHDFIPFVFTEEGKLAASLDIQSPALDFNAFPLGKDTKEKSSSAPAHPTLLTRKMESAIDYLEASLRVRSGAVVFHSFEATDVKMVGHYQGKCTPEAPPKGCVQIDTFSASVFGNAPLEAAFTVENLNDPLITADARVRMPLTDLNAMFPPDQLRFHGGAIDLSFHYRGQPHDHFDIQNDIIKADLSGVVKFSKAAIERVNKGYHLTDLDADISFNNKDLDIDRLTLALNENLVEAKGRFTNLLPFLFLPDRKVQASFEVFSPSFSFDHFLAPAKHKGKTYEDGHEPTPITTTVDSVLNNLNVNFKLRIDQLNYRNFKAGNVFGDIHMNKDQVKIEEARMNMRQGAFQVKGSITGLQNNAPKIDVGANFSKADVAHVFRSFDNFGFEEISHQNVQGMLHADISFKAEADDDYNLDPASMEGQVNLKLENGELVNFPGLRDIHGFLIKNRGWEEVEFATLEKKFRLRDQQILIDDLLVISSALAFSVDGVYDLQQSGRTDLLFEVPLENLFKHGLTEEVEKHYRERKGGPTILIEMSHEGDSLRIRPVLSRRKHKEVGEE